MSPSYILHRTSYKVDMNSKELRTAYLEFFKSKEHLILPSDSLVPDDPTMLFTSAGMVQFKSYFTKERVPPHARITTSQKCLRTDDIEEVGDVSHHTFFEMLGNFSFGDYFKHEAIHWAWEFLLQHLKIDPNKLHISVYKDDDEAYKIWNKEIGVSAERIARLGEKSNYWPANAPSQGPNGPCGPCSEIFYDIGPQPGCDNPDCGVDCPCGRYVEIWNLVFMQFNREEGGKLTPLPSKNIDTGMGLERTLAVLNGTPTDYETDLFMPIIEHVEQISGAKYGQSAEIDVAMRVLADHIRGAVFVIADGVMPSNVGRGYVLRRIIRRAILRGKTLGLDKPFLDKLVHTVVSITADVYTEPVDREEFVTALIRSEEDKFRRTLDAGVQRLQDQIEVVKAEGSTVLPGDAVFTLYDTYGFPMELTEEVARAEGLQVDVKGFEAAMEEQRRRAKEASEIPSDLFAGGAGALSELERTIETTQFLGYDKPESEATVRAIIKANDLAGVADAGETVDIVLDRTPFYGEAGGQVGDTGRVEADGLEIEVLNTSRAGGFYVHHSKVLAGQLSVGISVKVRVDVRRRMAIGRNHTATHIMHQAIRNVLGEHAVQSGSVVEPDRLRFDFSHFQAVTPEEIRHIEDEVNEKILDELPVEIIETTVEEARKMGATALFGEKYGERVRVIRVGDYSAELCGGTHLHNSVQIGLFKIVSESSIGAGLRRIEAVTGAGAVEYVHSLEDRLSELSEILGVPKSELSGTVRTLSAMVSELRKRISELQTRAAGDQAGELAQAAQEVSGISVVAQQVATTDVNILRSLADGIADKLKSGVVVLGGVSDGKVTFVGKVTSDLVGKGVHAGNLLREVAKLAGGGGGGRPDFAQAGGKDPEKVGEALTAALDLVRQQIGA